VIIVYSTFPNAQEARKCARALVLRGLAACANILPSVESHYVWKGKVRRSREVILWVKGTRTQAPKIKKFLELNHPYETPAIVFFRPQSVNKAFKKWLEKGSKQ
jgi:periplasmic divalent cation tolerance protein